MNSYNLYVNKINKLTELAKEKLVPYEIIQVM
jgi:hypothetical protein